MGKTSKKTKAKKKDFNKVKLKVGKQKPKADNVTNVTFKSQSIYIPEQLKQSQDEVLTHRKKGWNDLLMEVNHPSPTVRLQSLSGMKEIVAIEPNKLEHSRIFERILKLIVDQDSTVRKQCLAVLGSMFTSMSATQMKPHFHLVLSHLFCAISHIDHNVQKDSLQVVDLCLDHFPTLIGPQDSCRIIENFIDLISVKQGTKGRRSLSMNLSKKESSLTWRIRVLLRLQKMLDIALKTRNPEVIQKKSEIPSTRWDSGNVGSLLMSKQNTLGLLLRNLDVPMATTTTSSTIEDLMKSVVPLLVQCWVEVWVEGTAWKGSEDKQVKVLMNCVVTILHQICSTDHENNKMTLWIRQTYMPAFKKHIFSNFPFEEIRIDDMPAKKRKKKDFHTGDLLSINLTICNFALALFKIPHKQNGYEENEAIIAKTSKFVSKTLNLAVHPPTLLNSELLQKILDYVKDLGCISAKGNLPEVFQALTAFYKSLQARNSLKTKLVNFFCDLYQLSSKNQLFKFDDILSNLPSQLNIMMKEVVKYGRSVCKIHDSSTFNNLKAVLLFMRLASSRRNQIFMESLRKNTTQLLETLQHHSSSIFCTNSCLVCCELQTQLIESVVTHLEELSEISMDVLLRICLNIHYSASSVCYVVDILMLRFQNDVKQPMTNMEKISLLEFLLKLVLGDTDDQKNKVFVLERHEIICQHLVKCFVQLWNESEKLKLILIEMLRKKLKNVDSISSKSWIGFFHLAKNLHSDESLITDFTSFLSQIPSTVESFTQFVLNEFLFEQFKNALINN